MRKIDKKVTSASVLTALAVLALPFASVNTVHANVQNATASNSATSPSLSVTTSSLPTGNVNQSYKVQLAANETQGLTWSELPVTDLNLTFHDANNQWDSNSSTNYDVPTSQGAVWFDGTLTPGQTVTVHYNGSLASGQAVHLHAAFNQDFNNVVKTSMTKNSGGDWTCSLSIPSDATEVSLYFDDGQSNWDSNVSSQNYNFWTGTSSLVPGQSATIAYDGSLASTSADPITMHWGFDGWSDGITQDTTMTQSASGTWAAQVIVPGGLPAGMTLSSSGVLSGTPTVAGTYYVPVQVTDASGNKATYTYTLTVDKASTAVTNTLTLAPTALTAGYSDGSLHITNANANFTAGQVSVSLSNAQDKTVTIPSADVSVVDATHLDVTLPTGDSGLGAGDWNVTVKPSDGSVDTGVLTVNPYTTTQNNVLWDGIYTNQTDSTYVSNPDPSSGQAVTIAFRAYSGNLTGATLQYWDTAKNSGGSVQMKPGKTFGPYQLWTATIPSSNGGTLWYRMDMNAGSATACLSGDGLHGSDTSQNNFPIPVSPMLLSEFEGNAGDTITATQNNGDLTAGTTTASFVDQTGKVVATVNTTNASFTSTQFQVPKNLTDGLYTVKIDSVVKDGDGAVNNEFDRTAKLNIGPLTGWMADLKHDSFHSFYRAPFGAVATNTAVTLRLRGPKDLSSATLHVWNAGGKSGETDYQMTPVTEMTPAQISAATGDDASKYSWWEATIPASDVSTAGDMWYQFAVDDNSSPAGVPQQAWYDDNGSQEEGVGQVGLTSSGPSYQLSVYKSNFQTPNWMKHAVVYEVFPDRFFNGDIANDQNPNTDTAVGTVDGTEQLVPVQFHNNWSDRPYDPGITANSGDPNYSKELALRGDGQWNMDFFGGDLKGIQDKLDYLQSLGVNTLYLTPIFQSDSVHKYDTGNFKEIDPGFGTMQDYLNLVSAAKKMGMHIIIDSAFEDTGSDSLYFNRFGNYNSVGAWQQYQNGTKSDYYSWFDFTPSTNGNGQPIPYASWWGYDTLPLTNTSNLNYQQFVYGGSNSVAQYWIRNGASGWRLDSADNSNFNVPWWSAFRQSVKSVDPNAIIVGEIWNNPTQDNGTDWLTGDTFDSVMNYQFRNAALDFFAGNYDDGNEVHQQVNAAGFNQELMKMYSEYPLQSMFTMLNLVDSHDTMRILTVLEGAKSPDDPTNTAFDQATFKPSIDQLTTGMAKLKLLSDFQYTFAGDPMVFAGDEAGVQGYKDPLNRVTYPWGSANQNLLNHYRLLGAIRNAYPELQTGSFQPLLEEGNTYAFARTITGGKDALGNSAANGTAIVAMNNSGASTTVTVPVSTLLPDGTVLLNALTNQTVMVKNGSVQLNLGAYEGAILVNNFGGPVATLSERGGSQNLTWTSVPGATGYRVLVADSEGKFVPTGRVLPASTNSLDVTNMQGPSAVQFEVVAEMEGKDTAQTTSLPVTMPALPLTAPDASAKQAGINIIVQWPAVPGASSYEVYGQDKNGSWHSMTTVKAHPGNLTVKVRQSDTTGNAIRVAAANADDYAVTQPIVAK